MVLGGSTKAVVGWIIVGITGFGTTIYIGGAVRFSFVQKWFPTQSIVKLASPRLTCLSESDCCLLILDSIRTCFGNSLLRNFGFAI